MLLPRAIPTGLTPDPTPGKLDGHAALLPWTRPSGHVGHGKTRVHPRWLRPVAQTVPHADVLRLPDGPYLQEDAHERIIPALLHFLARSNQHKTDAEPIAQRHGRAVIGFSRRIWSAFAMSRSFAADHSHYWREQSERALRVIQF